VKVSLTSISISAKRVDCRSGIGVSNYVLRSISKVPARIVIRSRVFLWGPRPPAVCEITPPHNPPPVPPSKKKKPPPKKVEGANVVCTFVNSMPQRIRCRVRVHRIRGVDVLLYVHRIVADMFGVPTSRHLVPFTFADCVKRPVCPRDYVSTSRSGWRPTDDCPMSVFAEYLLSRRMSRVLSIFYSFKCHIDGGCR